MRHEMLTQRARFCIGVMAKKGTLSQHFVTHVVPPLGVAASLVSVKLEYYYEQYSRFDVTSGIFL